MIVYGYVYMVRNKINNKIYFGITVNSFKERYDGDIAKYTHNKHLKNAIKKYGIENFEINEQFDIAYSEDELYDLEDLYICTYNTLDDKYGYNKMRSGSKHKGNGRQNKEVRQKISESQQGEKHWNYSKTTSEETRQKISNSEKGENNHFYGKQHTDEVKQKISNSRKKKIICLETKQVFDSAKDASLVLQISNVSICNCLKGKSKTSGGYHWMYYEDYLSKAS